MIAFDAMSPSACLSRRSTTSGCGERCAPPRSRSSYAPCLTDCTRRLANAATACQGERQRLAIARALYRDPAVLVVDEGTANLDNEIEAAIEQTLAGLRGQKTIIVIAHRLPLVKNCDRIYLLRRGKLENSGAFSDLLSTDPAFRWFAGSQREFASNQLE